MEGAWRRMRKGEDEGTGRTREEKDEGTGLPLVEKMLKVWASTGQKLKCVI